MTSCEVCCEDFNKSSRARVNCQYCPYKACAGCAERYLLETVDDAHCMACRKGWSRENLVANFTQKFVTRSYKRRREDLLYEREKSLMPATQPFVECEKKIRQYHAEISRQRAALEKTTRDWNALASKPVEHWMRLLGTTDEFEAQVAGHKRCEEQRKLVNCMQIDIQHIEWIQNRLAMMIHGGRLETEKRQFVRACPYQDCRGFLSTAWKCGMCDMWTCPTCHEVKGPNKDVEHTCNPDNVATARLLDRDSRNCPKCASLIFKINGCDQMWCTQCHTAFSWKTGRVEGGVVHNPHYFEAQRLLGRVPRAHGDVPCGGFPDWPPVAQRIVNCSVELRNIFRNAYRSFGHGYHVLIPRYRTNDQEENRDLRIKLMIGDINEEEFKKKIQQREKARQRKTDIRQVLEMFTAVLNDLFQTFIQTRDVVILEGSLVELRSHTNDTFSALSKRWSKCAVPRVSEFYDLT
jgi:hypothetical protein